MTFRVTAKGQARRSQARLRPRVGAPDSYVAVSVICGKVLCTRWKKRAGGGSPCCFCHE